jgi:hypothetical protein
MAKEHIEIKTDEGVKEIVIREGNAAPIDSRRNISLAGTLRAPFDFLKQKISGVGSQLLGSDVPLNLEETQTIYNPRRSYLVANRDEGTLRLMLNERDPFMDVVEGKLEFDKSWKDFCINEEKLFNLNELIKLVKRNKFKFADPAEHSNFLLALSSFNARVTTTIKHHRDQGGSSMDMIEKVVAENKNAPSFRLNVPIYKGYEKKLFTVQTCLDASSSNRVDFYFESVDLYELIDSEKERAFSEELKRFEEQFNCSVVWTS